MEKTEKKPPRAQQSRAQEILEAAFDEFTAKGYAAARVEDIAARLGVSKGAIYLYFSTKEVLFEETFRPILLVPSWEGQQSRSRREARYCERH